MYVFQVVSQSQPAWYKPSEDASTTASTVREVTCENGIVLIIGDTPEPIIEFREVMQILSHGVLLNVQHVPEGVPDPSYIVHQQMVTRTHGTHNSKLAYSMSYVEGGTRSPQKTWSVSSATLGNLQRFLEGWNGKSAALSDSVGIVSLVL